MWTDDNRGRYDRSKLRYPSDLTDEEWRLVEPLIPPAKRGGGKRTVAMREVVNGLMYVLSTMPMARDPEGPAGAEHGSWLPGFVGLRRHAEAPASCLVRPVSGEGRAGSQSDGGHHRQPER